MLVCQERPSVGAVGFQIFIATKLDLTDASLVEIHYEKPGGAKGSWTAEAYTLDGTYGARYVTAAAEDLDEPENWQLQVWVEMPGFTGGGEVATMKVIKSLYTEPAP